MKINIIGAGLSGSLLATLLARKGLNVTVYERRPDRRKAFVEAGRSINLALSVRGMAALNYAGLQAEMTAIATRMYGRINHPLGGTPIMTRYSVKEENCLYSVSRAKLNEVLMDAAEAAGATLLFEQQCENVDLQTNVLTFLDVQSQKEYQVPSEITLACDGANSAIRRAMTLNTDFQHSQEPFRVSYKELCIPPDEGGKFQMEANGLHIWGRDNGDFMMIALPNLDGTFTCTLFMPVEGEKRMENLDTPEKVTQFFETYFPDALPLMPTLIQDYFTNPNSALNIVKCYPWIVGDKLALFGDACHAVVPFYGQGVNASFEDVIEMNRCIEEFGNDWAKIMATYQENRKANSDAISQMAAENYSDMAKSGMLEFQLRKMIELGLEKRYPSYQSQYELVSFSQVPYAEAQQRGWDNQILLTRIIESLTSVKELGLENALAQKGVNGLLEEVKWEDWG